MLDYPDDIAYTYHSKFRNWEVFYPFVEVYLDYQLNEYETTWAF
jgi:hypothetical protein